MANDTNNSSSDKKELIHSPIISKPWFYLSIGSLLLAGLMSLAFIFGRAPFISKIFTDPMWVKRVLVVHVDLALIIFLYSFICGMFLLIPRNNTKLILQKPALYLAIIGTLILIFNLAIPNTTPVLNNYVPVLDHKLYLVGLLLFGISLIMVIANRYLFFNYSKYEELEFKILAKDAIPALQASAILFIVSIILFVISYFQTEKGLPTQTYYEFMMWGGGHILQFVNAAATVAVWLMLFKKITKRTALSYKFSAILFIIYVIPPLFSPLLIQDGTSSGTYYIGFSQYMRWGIFPIVSTIIIVLFYQLWKAGKEKLYEEKALQNPLFNGLIVSMTFMSLGFLIGASIRGLGPNTLTPAHYHSTLGSVTIAFMTATYVLMEVYGKPFPTVKVKKLAAKQPFVFGIGMLLFVIGFAYAGSHGLERKKFGTDQIIATNEAMIGLIIAGIGGLLAVTGGIMFLIAIWKSFKGAK
ncbi:MAG: cbb3-type cytochrome c oxidase subunit I [Brumimicrobium sp.]|nr:cbb3-type cytochrome c oxidase subunit I [Brumimicrobium sp.]